ncbi:predicted protein [Uncinocarpus reesii 1704]|uniref:Transcription factor domain-containing protein n=1 Tax=Uncinocarpus reesii (strain UAMH 1704) TaxID=336963 RepID=C4JUF7_UNCRE|nr:uncharacterized protein UREG_04760 [Uncinocarpus reesii 1704]EEP79918.1 predicted protein [Uncinocarpus reesii 1704]
MPPKSRKVRASAAPATTASDGPADGHPPSSKQQQDVFHFVSVNPTSEVQKSHNRTVIRSHASKYIWRQHRAGRSEKGGSRKPSARDSEPALSAPAIPKPSTHEPSWSLPPPPTGPAELESGSSSSSLARESEEPPTKVEDFNEVKPSPYTADASLSPVLYRQERHPGNILSANMALGNSYDLVDGPFNQLTSWLADPGHIYPSMLGESAITVSELWPGLVLGASNQKWDREDAAENWLPRAMKNPPLFTAFLYGAAGHMQTRKRLEGAHFSPQTKEEKLEQIVCETETIKQLNQMMQKPSQACSDEVILAVLCMAFNRIDYSGWTVSDPWPKAPLRNLQWLDVYGGLSLNDHHIKGLLALIEMRGGLSQMKMPGLAETLSTSGVMLSTKYLVKPRLPFVPIFEETAEGRTPHWPTLLNPAMIEGQPDPIATAGLPADISEILQCMRDYNNVINVYSQGLLPELELAVIADRRNWIQYNLVSLRSVYEYHEAFFDAHKTYEMCRLAAMIYSMLVIFPLPAANRPFKRIASMARMALMETETEPDPFASWRPGREMLLWALVLAGMAAKGTPDREWFVGKLAAALATAGPGTWEEVKEALGQVMWMDSVCDMGGQALWMDAMLAGGAGTGSTAGSI